MICPGCGYRDAPDGDVCRECAGQLAFITTTGTVCGVCGGCDRNKFNQCTRCARRRSMLLYRRSHGIPEDLPLMSRSEAARRGIQIRQAAAWERRRDLQRWHQHDRRTA